MEKIYKECVQCESTFYVKQIDEEWFISKNLLSPKRCWKCRQLNKKTAQQAIEMQKKMDSKE